MPALRAVLRAHVSATIFIASLAGGTVLHLGLLPVARHLAAAHVNRILGPILTGRITIERVHKLRLTELEGIDARVDDENGHPLLRIKGLDVRVSTLDLVRSLWRTGQPISIALPAVSIEDVDLALDPDENGTPKIARALSPRSAPSSSPAPSSASPGIRLVLPDIRISHARVHAPLSGPSEAELKDVSASLVFSSAGLVIDVPRAIAGVEGLPNGGRADGVLQGHVERPPPGPVAVRASWDGAAAAIHETADFAIHGDRIDATLDVARTGQAEVCALLPEWPVAAVCAAHAEAHGVLPRIPVSLHASIGGGTLDASGSVTTGPSIRSEAHFDLDDFDGHSLVTPLPVTNVSTSGDVAVTVDPSGDVSGTATLALRHADLGATHLPAGNVTATFSRSANGVLHGSAEATIREPGAPTVVTVRLDPRDGAPVLTFVADARAPALELVPETGGALFGDADLHAAGTVFLGSQSIDAIVTASGNGLRVHGASIAHARLDARAIGKLAAPMAHVEIAGEQMEDGPVQLSAFQGRGDVMVDEGVAAQNIVLDVAGDAGPVQARVASAHVGGSGLQLDGVRVDGLGDPITGWLHVSPSAIAVRAQASRIQVVRLGSLVALPVRDGLLALDIDASTGPGSASGRFAVDLSHAVVGGLRDARAHVEALVKGRRVSGQATVSADDLGAVQVRSSVLEIGEGPLLSVGPWRQAWGRVDVDAHADLAKVAARLPVGALPFTDLRGTVHVHAAVGRDSLVDMTPEVEVTATTQGLVLAGTRSSGPWRMDGLDPSIHVAVNGDTGATFMTAEVADPTGELVTLGASSNAVPYSAIFSDQNVLNALVAMPFDAKLEIPARRLDSLPAALGTGSFRGSLQGEVNWRGSTQQPRIDFNVSFDRGRAEPRLISLPVDVTVAGHYDGKVLDVTVEGTQKGKRLAQASAVVNAVASDWLAGNARWTASARAKLDDFPLRSFETLDDRQVRGSVSGDLAIDRLHDDARASGDLHFDNLEVGDVACRTGEISMVIDGHVFDANARLEQADGGTIALNTRLGTHWGNALVPEIDATSLAQGTLKAKQFRAALLLPFLAGTLSQLDGKIDADAKLQVDPTRGSARPEGSMTLTGGTFELGSMGSEFRDASAKITLSPAGIVRLEDAVARGTSGRIKVTGAGWLKGLGFGGASASLQISADDPLPLVVDGVQLGKLDGHVDVTMSRTTRELDLDVSVPNTRLELPSSSDSRNVQDLGDVDGVRVGTAVRAETFVEAPLDAIPSDADTSAANARRAGAPTKITVRLGRDVRVVRGNTLDVRLVGQPTIVIGQDVRVSGQIRLVRGLIDVQGKPFELEPGGTVTFVGDDATNPQVVLTAQWTAPDSTRIYAAFTGPLKTGKVTLRSEPAKSQNEILALILFGTSDQPSNASVPQTTSMAAAAGGVATQPLNQALGGVNRALDKMGLAGGISTKVDTSTPNPRPEVKLQIARDISLQVAWVLGLPPASSPDTTLVTLDWRFLKKWSLETTVGDMGTSIVDVIWQHRY